MEGVVYYETEQSSLNVIKIATDLENREKTGKLKLVMENRKVRKKYKSGILKFAHNFLKLLQTIPNNCYNFLNIFDVYSQIHSKFVHFK